MSKHKWVGKRLGGNPGEAGSYEFVRYCEICGWEDPGEDEISPCPRVTDPVKAALVECVEALRVIAGCQVIRFEGDVRLAVPPELVDEAIAAAERVMGEK
jgi:hypothetical protein